ncbi:MAG: CBS domain-containing protein [Fuerstiella sp.]
MQQLPVSELMRDCECEVVPDSIRLREAAEIFITRACPFLVAADEHGKICGVVQEASVIRELMANSCRDATVAPILSRHVETIRDDAELFSVLHLFRCSCHAVIPVVDEQNQVVGLLYRRDVVKLLLSDGSAETAADSGTDRSTGPGPHFLERRTPQHPASHKDTAKPDELPGH